MLPFLTIIVNCKHGWIFKQFKLLDNTVLRQKMWFWKLFSIDSYLRQHQGLGPQSSAEIGIESVYAQCMNRQCTTFLNLCLQYKEQSRTCSCSTVQLIFAQFTSPNSTEQCIWSYIRELLSYSDTKICQNHTWVLTLDLSIRTQRKLWFFLPHDASA